MYCAISGEAPQEPVVCKECGAVFERRLAVKYIDENGKCPCGEPLAADELIAVKTTGPVHPRTSAATSIPGLLQHFQNEWDATMLETYTLKIQLDSTREELANALYRLDAASRVIARVMKERDEARAALQQVGVSVGGAAENGDRDGNALPADVLARMTALQAQLAGGRKTRPCTRHPKEKVAELAEAGAYPIHKASKPGIAAVAVHPGNASKVLTGGDDMTAVVFDVEAGKKSATLAGHSKKVTHVAFHPQHDVLLTGSADKTARVWGAASGSYSTVHVLEGHEQAVTGLSLHPIGEFAATASKDATWALFDIRSGARVCHIQDESITDGFSSLSFHPDGMLVGSGSDNGVVRLWDMNTREVAAAFEDAVGAVLTAFSENGYYLLGATASAVHLWDLRKQRQLRSIELPKAFKATGIDVEYSGTYTAVSGKDVRVFETKTLEEVAVLSDASKKVNGVAWARDSSSLASVSQDKNLRIYRL